LSALTRSLLSRWERSRDSIVVPTTIVAILARYGVYSARFAKHRARNPRMAANGGVRAIKRKRYHSDVCSPQRNASILIDRGGKQNARGTGGDALPFRK